MSNLAHVLHPSAQIRTFFQDGMCQPKLQGQQSISMLFVVCEHGHGLENGQNSQKTSLEKTLCQITHSDWMKNQRISSSSTSQTAMNSHEPEDEAMAGGEDMNTDFQPNFDAFPIGSKSPAFYKMEQQSKRKGKHHLVPNAFNVSVDLVSDAEVEFHLKMAVFCQI